MYASSWAAAGLRPSFDAGAGFLKADDVSPRQQQLASSEWPSSFEALTPFGDQARSERVNSFASFVAGADESDCEADYDADGYASDEDDADSY